MGVPCSNQSQNKQLFNPTNLPYNIHILAYIWSDNGHNLFDYESEALVKKHIEFDFQGRVIQLDRDIVALTKNEFVRNQKELLQFRCNVKHVEISGTSKIDQCFWKIIRPQQASYLPTLDKQKLGINSVIKLGRVQLTVLDYSFAYEFDDKQGVPDEMEDKGQLNQSDCIDGNLVCRICLSKLSTIENPFVWACKCIGSVKYIHLKCLQKWISSMVKTRAQNGVTLYYWKSMKCELCKGNFKTQFKYRNIKYNLCEINKPKEPYLVLQIDHSDKSKEQGLYVIETKYRGFVKIGRTQDCDIKLHDISVSRHHASIIVNHAEQSLQIEDNCSKFGTLIKAQNEDLQIYLDLTKKLSLQIGRTVLVISLDKKNNKNKSIKYRVPQQYEVFRQIKQHDDDDQNNNQQNIEPNQEEVDDGEDILINDPNFDYELEMSKANQINFLTGSILQKDVNNQ